MVGCSIFGCKSRSELKIEDLTFHSFPSDPIVKNKWVQATGRMNWEPTKFSKICSLHFNDDAFTIKFKNKRINRNALPVKHIHIYPSTSHPCQSAIEDSSKRHLECPETSVSKTQCLITPSTSQESCQPAKAGTTKRHLERQETSVSEKRRLISSSRSQDTSQSAGTTNRNQKYPETSISKEEEMLSPTTSPRRSTKRLQMTPKRLLEDTKTSVFKRRMKTGSLPRANLTPRKKKMQQSIVKLEQRTRLLSKKLRAVRQSHRRLMKKTADLKSVLAELQCKLLIGSEQHDVLESIGEGNADIIKAILEKNKPKTYSQAVRKFALCLNFISPKAYEYVRKEFNTCLPHPKTLCNWYSCIDCEPGFTTESFNVIKELVDRSEKPIICALSVDEMSIRQHLQWDGRRIVGYVNVGDNLEGDNLRLAKDALVFMLTCLNGHWKLPVGYFLTNGVNGEQKSSLLKNCIMLALNTGIQVAAVTFDGCPSNFAMARLLGANFDDPLNIQPAISINGKKIVVMPDACHMIKLVRNTLGDKRNIIDANNETISWEFIEKLHTLQENEKLHLANKIRKEHIHFKKQIMKVRLATQTFSRSVAEAITFCKNELNLSDFNNSDGTVKFIKIFNDLFDIFNSRRLTAPGLKKPISERNWSEVKAAIDAAREYILGLKFSDGQKVINSGRKTGFLGFLTSIESLKFIKEFYVTETKYLTYICTFRLSQDHLELFFSAVRSKGGFNNNPTVTQFKAAYKRLLIHGEIKNINSGNCIQLDNLNILTCSKIVKKINETKNRLLSIDENTSFHEEFIVPEFPEGHDYMGNMCLSKFSKEIVAYIAGFVTTKLATIIKCDQCIGALISEKYNGFIAQRDRGGLTYPSQDVVDVCIFAENALRLATKVNGLSFLDKNTSLPVLISTVLKKFLGKEIFSNLKEHVKDQSPLDNHIILLIKAIGFKYLEIRIHYMTKEASQKEEKIRNVSNKLVLFKGQ